MSINISLITPCHPKEDLTLVAKSVQEQTFKDFEWMIIYDTIGRKQAKIRNDGARRAAGKWLFFLDADVILKPDALLKLITAITTMQSKRHSFAYCKWSNQPIAGDHNYKPIIVGEPLNYKRLTETNWISTNTLINKTHFFEIGGFDESLPRFQDWDLFLTFLEKGFLGIFCDEILFETGHRSSKIFDRSEGDYPKYDEVLAVLRKKHKII